MPRESLYKPEYAEQAKKLCMLLGATTKKLALFFEVAPRTIDNWLVAHEDFAAAVRFGKEVADAEVAFSTFQRAIGYSHPETKVHFMPDGKAVTHEVMKHYPPDTGAAAFWLKNRQGWRDKVELSGGGPMELLVRYDTETKPTDETPAAGESDA